MAGRVLAAVRGASQHRVISNPVRNGVDCVLRRSRRCLLQDRGQPVGARSKVAVMVPFGES
jgi:hypothetical protein